MSEEKPERLEKYFELTHLPFEMNGDDKQDRIIALKPVVYCNNVPELIKFTCDERKIQQDAFFIKIGIDGGGGFLKITLSLVQKAPEASGKVGAKTFKSTGVKKLLLLAVVPGIPEKYFNIQQIWSTLLELNQIDAMISGDLKIINLLLGVMGHSSSHPCPYCITAKKDLADRCVAKRSISSIRENYEKWRSCGANEKVAKNYSNCVNAPLLCGSTTDETLGLCPPPALHITLGVVNAVYKRVESVDPDIAQRWVTKSSCARHSQYGFTGRNCHKLLENRSILNTDGQLGLLRKILDLFQKVYDSCFKDSLEPDFEEYIRSFAELWKEARLPNSSKFHILKFHVPQFCKMSQSSLGKFCEQATEAVHFDFGTTWDRVKVPEASENYDSALLHSVVLYNSNHI